MAIYSSISQSQSSHVCIRLNVPLQFTVGYRPAFLEGGTPTVQPTTPLAPVLNDPPNPSCTT